jgi:hypothetical protein
MKLVVFVLLLCLGFIVEAYPPAPPHKIFGTLRDEHGNPILATATQLILDTGAAGARHATSIDPGVEPGANYVLLVPMDSGGTGDLYKPDAMRAAFPFKVQVIIGNTTYLPIEMRGDYSRLGRPGGETRLDLTLGEDANNNGLPDAWERALIAASGGKLSMSDLRPDHDPDGSGMTILQKYLAGVYDLTLTILGPGARGPVVEFMTLPGRTYSLRGSSDLATWTRVGFRLLPEGEEPRTHLYSVDAMMRRAEIILPPDGPGGRFFQLVVE